MSCSRKEIDEIGGVGTQIGTIGLAESALLVRIPEWERALYSRPPGANTTFSGFESGPRIDRGKHGFG